MRACADTTPGGYDDRSLYRSGTNFTRSSGNGRKFYAEKVLERGRATKLKRPGEIRPRNIKRNRNIENRTTSLYICSVSPVRSKSYFESPTGTTISFNVFEIRWLSSFFVFLTWYESWVILLSFAATSRRTWCCENVRSAAMLHLQRAEQAQENTSLCPCIICLLVFVATSQPTFKKFDCSIPTHMKTFTLETFRLHEPLGRTKIFYNFCFLNVGSFA